MVESNILILDFGGQYSQLIARRIREFNIYSLIKSYKITSEEIKEINPTGIILSGRSNSVTGFEVPKIDPDIFNLDFTILGIC